MSNVLRRNRKATDQDIIRLNSVGLSLTTVGKLLDCHPATISLRLKSLGIDPADTRRTFMEEIYLSLPDNQKTWLEGQLGPHNQIQDFVRNLLVEKFLSNQTQG
jgi:hypothetical protein